MLSVVVITYNHMNMIKQCLNSLLLSKTDDIELVISDDCSTDATVSVIENWLAVNEHKFKNVIFIKNKKNLGTVKNVIQAVDTSNSAYIKMIAGDDWFVAGALDVMREFILNNRFDAAFSSLVVAYQDSEGNIEVANEIVPASRIPGFFEMDSKDQFRQLTRWCCLPAPGNLFTRKFWNTIELAKAKATIAEDWAMWLSGASKSMKFMEIPATLVVYRKHAKSVSRDSRNPRVKKSLREVAWVLWNIGFSRKEWLTFSDKARLFLLWFTIRTVSLFPVRLIAFTDKVRRFLGAIIFKRSFK